MTYTESHQKKKRVLFVQTVSTNLLDLIVCAHENMQLAYLPYKRRDLILDEENADGYTSLEGNAETNSEICKEKKSRKQGLLNWFKLRVCIHGN